MLQIFPLQQLAEFGAEQLGLYSYQNYFEVLILSLIIYKTLRWLQQDHTKHLILYVYAYMGLMIGSYQFNCIALFWTLFFFMPVAMLLTLIAHQKQLQKNFVLKSSKDLTIHSLPTKNWLELFIRSTLLAAYKNKQTFCIIERSDHLAEILQAPCNLYVPVQQEILEIVLTSTALQSPCMIWITQSGIINSVNVSWHKNFLNELLPNAMHYQNQAAFNLLTSKTDAIVFSIDPTTRLATFWHQGKSLQQITIDQLMTSCKQILYKNLDQSFKSGATYAVKNNADHTASKLH
jgi:hypothetical protein